MRFVELTTMGGNKFLVNVSSIMEVYVRKFFESERTFIRMQNNKVVCISESYQAIMKLIKPTRV